MSSFNLSSLLLIITMRMSYFYMSSFNHCQCANIIFLDVIFLLTNTVRMLSFNMSSFYSLPLCEYHIFICQLFYSLTPSECHIFTCHLSITVTVRMSSFYVVFLLTDTLRIFSFCMSSFYSLTVCEYHFLHVIFFLTGTIRI